ncbi:hypothetical protein HY967_01090 [Candidatus Jorgensenbacteria bacterium]|nr:hypothetical protein [Candidatus Jorgensenbacteria bacterium]
MPCDIGFKSYEPIKIPEPEPQVFTLKAEAPNIDADLLDKLGEEDPEFMAWASELDTRPLLEEALKRTLAKLKVNDLNFEIGPDGMLKAKGSFYNSKEKKRLEEAAKKISDRWQFEILGIVTELLDYDVVVKEIGNGLVLEAQEQGRAHPSDFIKVTKQGGNATLTFEHFKTRKALEVEMAKFLTLAHRLGVKIALDHLTVKEGNPFPDAAQQTHTHRHRHSGETS